MPSPTALRRWLLILALLGVALCIVHLLLALLLQAEHLSTFLPRSSASSADFPSFFRYQRENIVPTAEESKWVKSRFMNNSTPLGNWLLSPKDSAPPKQPSNRSSPFLILVWEHGPFLERRHLRRFSRSKKFSPWEDCSVNNCRLTYESADLHTADAVIFHLHFTKSAKSLPERRNRNQRWIFLSDESPLNTFFYNPDQELSDYNGLFNWSMTYRMDSDVPVPYGRTILISSNEVPNESMDFLAKKHNLVAVLGSNCSGENNRWKYIQKLKNVLGDGLQILGRCLSGNTTACPGHFEADCPALGSFKFYLAFENSNCREYLTEKVWWNAYAKLAVPVIMGAARRDCERLLPPDSFLHVEDFANAASLANYIRYLGRDQRQYEKLHAWRSTHRVLNEHGYFGTPSKHYCRVCEALNYNSVEPKIYDDLERFSSKKRDCTPPYS